MGYSRANEEWIEQCEETHSEFVAKEKAHAKSLGISDEEYNESFRQGSFWACTAYMWRRMGAYHKLQFALISFLQVGFIIGIVAWIGYGMSLQSY